MLLIIKTQAFRTDRIDMYIYRAQEQKNRRSEMEKLHLVYDI